MLRLTWGLLSKNSTYSEDDNDFNLGRLFILSIFLVIISIAFFPDEARLLLMDFRVDTGCPTKHDTVLDIKGCLQFISFKKSFAQICFTFKLILL